MEETIENIRKILIPVESSILKGISPLQTDRSVYAEFNSNSFYKYNDVTEAELKSIMEDKSVGSKLRSVMKEKQYQRLAFTSEIPDPDFKRKHY